MLPLGTNARATEQRAAPCKESRQAIVFYRQATWRWQDKAYVPRTKTEYAEKGNYSSCRYLRWVAQLWVHRSSRARRAYRFSPSDPVRAIRLVFGPYASQALAVSYCETGGTYSTNAANGQYLGLFQMGSHERATYGHGASAWEQAKAAYRYFLASGSDWSPWECKP